MNLAALAQSASDSPHPSHGRGGGIPTPAEDLPMPTDSPVQQTELRVLRRDCFNEVTEMTLGMAAGIIARHETGGRGEHFYRTAFRLAARRLMHGQEVATGLATYSML